MQPAIIYFEGEQIPYTPGGQRIYTFSFVKGTGKLLINRTLQ